MTLRGVGAGFIERVYFRQILRDGAAVEFAETHVGYFLKTVRPPAREVANEDRGPHFMRPAAQSPQKFFCMREIPGLADHLAVERDECVRAQDNRVG